MTGQDVGEAALHGAMWWAIGEGANMLVGHAVGLLASHKWPTPNGADGTFTYEAPWKEGAITFGNVIIGKNDVLDETVVIGGRLDPQGRTVRAHEIAHTHQPLGPAYLVAHGASLLIGGLLGMDPARGGFANGTHTFNVFERGWIDAPNW